MVPSIFRPTAIRPVTMLYGSRTINIEDEMTSRNDHIGRSDTDLRATGRLRLSLVSRRPRVLLTEINPEGCWE
jgi:hypothetical protein